MAWPYRLRARASGAAPMRARHAAGNPEPDDGLKTAKLRAEAARVILVKARPDAARRPGPHTTGRPEQNFVGTRHPPPCARPGHASVDPWDEAMPRRPGRRFAALWPLGAGLLLAAALALLASQLPAMPPLQAAAAVALLALALLLPLLALWRQRRRMRSSLHEFSDALGNDDWRDAVQHLRDERSVRRRPSTRWPAGVETVLGESDRRWQALAELSADWYWESDAQHRLCWLSGLAPRRMLPGGDERVLAGTALRPDHGLSRTDAAAGARCTSAWRGSRTSATWSSRSRPALAGAGCRSAAGRATNAHGAVLRLRGRRPRRDRARLAHERLMASEQRWSTMTRLAADWYWQTDAEHRAAAVGAATLRSASAPNWHELVEGRTRWDAHPDALTPQQWAEHRADLDARRPFRSLQIEVDTGGGRFLWFSISGLPRFDGARRFIGYHGVGRDITARKQAEALLLRHNEALQRAVAERTQDLQQVNLDLDAFARQLAHELRTPIGQVQGLAQMLGERGAERLGAEERGLLDLQVQATTRMRDTVDALLALARSTLQPMPLETLDLSALAQQVADELPPLSRAAPLRWDIQCDMRVAANPAALKIVLANLMGNAAKFTRDAAQPRARIGLRAEGDDTARVSVQDNGVGFDPARADQLFRPFSRLHARDDYGGSGIGLSIVQRIVERHGGTVAARGEPGPARVSSSRWPMWRCRPRWRGKHRRGPSTSRSPQRAEPHHSRSLARSRAMLWLCNWHTRLSVTPMTAAISFRFMSCS